MGMDTTAGADQQDAPIPHADNSDINGCTSINSNHQLHSHNQTSTDRAPHDPPPTELIAQLDTLLAAFDNGAPPTQEQEADFLIRALTLFMPQRPLHWWCHPTLKRVSLEMLHLFAIAENEAVRRYKAIMEDILASCIDCLAEYHAGRHAYCQRSLKVYPEDKVKLFEDMLMAWDMTRLQPRLERFAVTPLHKLAKADRVELAIAMNELMIDPSLLLHPQHTSTASKLLASALDQQLAGKPQKSYEVCPGLFFLALHNDSKSRAWAVRNLKRSSSSNDGPVDALSFKSWKQFGKVFAIAFAHLEQLYTAPPQLSPEDQAVVSSFAVQPLAVWRGISACLHATSIHAIRADNDAKPKMWATFQRRLITTLLDHNTKSEFMEALACLRSLTAAIGHVFWNGEGSSAEARLQAAEHYLNVILEHPALDLCVLAQAGKFCRMDEANVEVPRRLYVDTYHWIASYAKSFKEPKDQDRLLRVAISLILAKIGHRMSSRLSGDMTEEIKARYTLLLEYDLILFAHQWEVIRRFFKTSGKDEGSLIRLALEPHWAWMSELFAKGHEIISTSSLPAQAKTRISSVFASIQSTAKQVVPGLMALDVEDMWVNFALYSRNTVQYKSQDIMAEDLAPKKPVAEPWFRLVHAMIPKTITDPVAEADIRDWQKLLIAKFSDLVLLPRVELKESAMSQISKKDQNLGRAVQALCQTYNDDLDILLRSNRILLSGIRQQGDSWVAQLLSPENKLVIVQLLKQWCSADEEVRSEALFMMRSAWKEVKRSSCLRMALEIGGDESLRGLTAILNEWCLRGSPGATTAPALFAMLEEAVTILFLSNSTDGEGGLYLQLFLELTSAQEVNHHLELIKELWNSIWISLAAGFEAGRNWHQQEVKSVVINTMMVLLNVGLVMIGEIKAMERLLEFDKPDAGDDDFASSLADDVLESSQQPMSAIKMETMPLEQVLVTVEHLSVWLFARDESVSSKVLKLTCAALELLADHNLIIRKDLYDRLDSIATNKSVIPTLLSEQLREDLWIQLSRHIELPEVIDLTANESPKLRPQDLRRRPSREDTIPQSETIVVSDEDDFGDLDETQLEDIDFDGDMKIDQEMPKAARSATPKTVTAAKPFFSTPSSLSSTAAIPGPPSSSHASQSKSPYFSTAHLPPGFMALAKKPVQSKLSFEPTVAPLPKPRTLPTTLTKFKLNISKPAPKAATPIKKGSKLSQMRQDHRRERVGIADAARMAREAARIQPRVAHTSMNEDQASSSDSDADSDSGQTGLEGLVEAQEQMLPQTIQQAKPTSSAKTAPRKTKLLDFSDISSAKPAMDSFATRQQKAREDQQRKQRLTPNLSGLHRQILSWDVSATGDQPPNGAEYRPIPKRFKNVGEYQRAFEPLLVLECWQQLIAAKEEVNPETDSVFGVVSSRMSIDDFQDTHMRMPQDKANSLMAEDVVVIYDQDTKNVFTSTGNAARAKPFLAKVQSITKNKGESVVVFRTCLKIEEGSSLLFIRPQTKWCILKLLNLTTTHREYAALVGMGYYELCSDVLEPPMREPFKPSTQLIQTFMDTYMVNTPQAHAIIGAIERKEGFTLIQGPPGTGKTKTILGLVGALLREDRNKSAAPVVRTARFTEENLRSGDVGRLLVCAPSNAAIDEIVKRLIVGIRNTSGQTFIPKVVRVGTLETIHSQVREVALETLIAKELEAKSNSKDDFQTHTQRLNELRAKQSQLHQELEKARLELVQAKEGTDMMVVAELQSKIKNINKAKWKHGQEMDAARAKQSEASQKKDKDRKEARDKILGQADVICSTLSASGHDLLTNAGFTFDTVIIDEAAQAVEISSLIPLKYNCKRCIMVGDPNQLPPTVISQLATKYDYNQSLFVRIQNNSPSSVYLLSIQYRMHPDISVFPSREFYQSLLKDGPSMAEKTKADWHRDKLTSPYRFFDVYDGRERVGISHSQHNPREAEVAVELIRYLCNNNNGINFFGRIGVISPYKQQVRSLKEIFSRYFGREILEAIDFNTVDGFQGQEKDLIIFSCVRASSGGRVGFLSDIRRMNVALTRARQSLFILGHADTLRRERIWGDLVTDAETRRLFTKVDPSLFSSGRGYGAPKNIFRPAGSSSIHQTSKSVLTDRRNELYGRASGPSSTAVAIARPMVTMEDMMDIDKYPSLPSVEQPPAAAASSAPLQPVQARSTREPRRPDRPPMLSPAAKTTTVAAPKTGEIKLPVSPTSPTKVSLEDYRRQQQERISAAAATAASSSSGASTTTPLAGSKRHHDDDHRESDGASTTAAGRNGANTASSATRPTPSSLVSGPGNHTSRGGGDGVNGTGTDTVAKRPKMASGGRGGGGSSLFIKSKPMQSMKNTGPHVNATALKERLAAGVVPIRKSYPSGPAGQGSRPQDRNRPNNNAFNLDDVLGQMKRK
ncbi:DEAD-box type RNA helicase [Actinomortierella ambigua]|nr:DEAD-box type RNA helicase [Actinomortierella ambigua]